MRENVGTSTPNCQNGPQIKCDPQSKSPPKARSQISPPRIVGRSCLEWQRKLSPLPQSSEAKAIYLDSKTVHSSSKDLPKIA